MKKIISVLLVLFFLAAGCSDDDSSSPTLSPQDLVDLDFNNLTFDDFSFSGNDTETSVTMDFSVITGTVNNSSISWQSDSSDVTFSGGNATVVRPDYSSDDLTVTITATITNGDASEDKIFTITVLKTIARLIVFNSGQTTTGNFTESSHQGWCDTANSSLDLNLSTVKPFISRSGSNIKDIPVPAGTPVLAPDDSIIAASWADLWDTTSDLNMSLYDAGVLDSTATTDWWWSGSQSDGTAAAGNCVNWTDETDAQLGAYGTPDALNDEWISRGNMLCVNERPTLCVGWDE